MAARSGHAHHGLDKAITGDAVGAHARSAPIDGRTQGALGPGVRALDACDLNEGKQRRPQLPHGPEKRPAGLLLVAFGPPQDPDEACLQRCELLEHLRLAQLAALAGTVKLEQSLLLASDDDGDVAEIAAALHQADEVALEVGMEQPAVVGGEVTVGAEAITDDDAVVVGAEQRLARRPRALVRELEQGGSGRHRHPQPGQLPLAEAAGLIDVDDGAQPNFRRDGSHRRLQSFAGSFAELDHGRRGDGHLGHGADQLRGLAGREPKAPDQERDRGCEARAELAHRDARGQLGRGGRPALGADAAVELVLSDHGSHDRQLGHLVPQGLAHGHRRLEDMTAATAGRRVVCRHVVGALGWHGLTEVRCVPRHAATRLACLLLPLLALGPLGTGRLARVGRVARETGLQVVRLPLEASRRVRPRS